MHDPLVLVVAVKRPPLTPKEWRRALRIGDGYKPSGWSRLPTVLDIWHREPGGRDAFTVCKREDNWQWHVHHYHLRFWPVFNLRRWLFQPCAGCGRRFRYRDVRFSYMGTDKTWHEECQSLAHLRSDMLTMTETMDRLLSFYGIESSEQLREIVVRPDERRDQFLLWYRPWNRIERYRNRPDTERWCAPNEHITGR